MRRADLPDKAYQTERFTALDGVRALAILLVFCYHGALDSGPIRRHFWDAQLHLDVGVEIFFVLSGFLIYRPYALAHLQGRSAPRPREHLRRRALRIYPAYALALSVLFVAGLVHVRGVGGYFAHLSLTYPYMPWSTGRGLYQSWTLVVEVTFYALLPAWARLVRAFGGLVGRRRAEIFTALLVIAGSLVLLHRMRQGGLVRWVRPFVPAMPTLGTGMLLAVTGLAIAEESRWRERASRLTRLPSVWWLAAVAVFVWLSRRPYEYYGIQPVQRFRQDVAQALIAFLVVTPWVFGGSRRGLLRRLLECRPVVYLGAVSYGVYLWHFAALDAFGQRRLSSYGVAGAVAGMGLVLVGTVVIAALSWHLLERPILDRARRPRRADQADPSAVARQRPVAIRVSPSTGPR